MSSKKKNVETPVDATSNHVVSVAGIELRLESTIAPARLQAFSAPNALQNASVETTIELCTALASLKKFDGLMAYVLPGTYLAGPLPEGAIELATFLDEGAGVDDRLYLHVVFPSSNSTPINVGLLLKAFSHGWANGIQTILLEAYMDGGNPLITLAGASILQRAISAYALSVFGPFAAPSAPTDPFAQPTVPSNDAEEEQRRQFSGR